VPAHIFENSSVACDIQKRETTQQRERERGGGEENLQGEWIEPTCPFEMAPKKKGKPAKKQNSTRKPSDDTTSKSVPMETSQSKPQSSAAISSIPPSKEALKNYIETGGQKCLDLFQYLSTSAQW
jgi:hypothetical protein